MLSAIVLATLAAPAVEVHGWVDAYYAANANAPSDGANWLPGVGTTAKRANAFGLNLAALDVSVAPGPVGARLVLGAGSSTEVVHEGEPAGEGVGYAALRALIQASVLWQVNPKLQLEAGVFPSHIGLEVLASKDNWTYTRGWMGELSPYYQAGICARYQLTDQFAAQVHALNGWQLIGDNNNGKAVGAQVSFANVRASVALNLFAGPELPADDVHWRFFADAVATVKVSDRLSLAGTADLGRQALPGGSWAEWEAAAILARAKLAERYAIVARAEVYDDASGFMTGTAQTLADGTLTLEARPVDGLIAKLEGRYDRSTASVFTGSSGTRPDELLVVLGVVAAF